MSFHVRWINVTSSSFRPMTININNSSLCWVYVSVVHRCVRCRMQAFQSQLLFIYLRNFIWYKATLGARGRLFCANLSIRDSLLDLNTRIIYTTTSTRPLNRSCFNFITYFVIKIYRSFQKPARIKIRKGRRIWAGENFIKKIKSTSSNFYFFFNYFVFVSCSVSISY